DMLYPDKVNGQQVHDRTRVPVILQTLLFGFMIGVVGLPELASAETALLRKIRMGNHGKYTRVVCEFSAPVQYELSEDAALGIVSIRFLETTSQLPEMPVPSMPDCIDTLSIVQDSGHTIAKISFAPKEVTLNPFTIKDPDRVVLDVFCNAELVAPVPLTDSGEIEPTPIMVAEPVKEKPVETRPLIEQAQPAVKVDQIVQKQEPSSKRDNSQKYLLLLLAAITGTIVVLIALIIFQKRGLSESSMAGSPETAGEGDDMMRAIDTKIKEKLMKYDE
ncbi:MAG: hypothetical protein KJN80_09205, partial [Deltaproteobacteria bacterium]|nr:hypothetical protein [Deltaproteobacteria bacterium]